jgi:hypothetical protein
LSVPFASTSCKNRAVEEDEIPYPDKPDLFELPYRDRYQQTNVEQKLDKIWIQWVPGVLFVRVPLSEKALKYGIL